MFENKTLDEIADAWVRATREVRSGEKVKKAGEPYLKAFFEANPEARDYKGLVGLSFGRRVVIDTEKLKAQLGPDLTLFEKTITFQSLSLLTP